jgi:hypothetical protein
MTCHARSSFKLKQEKKVGKRKTEEKEKRKKMKALKKKPATSCRINFPSMCHLVKYN